MRPETADFVPETAFRSSKLYEDYFFMPKASKPRRILHLQKRMGTRFVHYIAVPTDIVRELGLSKGDRYHFHALGGILTYEPMGGD